VMDTSRLVLNLYVWHQAIEVLLQDAEAIKHSPVKLPNGYASLFQFLYEGAKSMEYLAKTDLRKHHIAVIGEYRDERELFVMWKHKGKTQLLRTTHDKLQSEAQARVEEFIEERYEKM